MNKKYLFKIFLFFLMILMLAWNVSCAMTVGSLTGNTQGTGDLKATGNKAITVVTTVGAVLSVIILIVLGIKYMLGSVEEKAEYKKTLMPFFIGSLFVFAASTIASIIYNIAIKF